MSEIYSIKVLVDSKSNFIENSLKEVLQQLSILERSNNVAHSALESEHIVEFKLESDLGFEYLHQLIQSISKNIQSDLIVLPWCERTIKPALLIMDMDSTLVQAETIDQIAEVAGVGNKVSEITESAMRGELNFTESLHARVSMLKGVELRSLQSVHQQLPLTRGAKQLIAAAKQNNCYTALVSGGFTMFAEPIVKQLGIDYLAANTLGVENGQLTGEVIGNVVDDKAKRETLLKLKKKLSLNQNQIIAIGDGANDLLMLDEAGTGIAFHAKPKVQHQAKAIINFSNLEAVNWLCDW